MRENIGYRTELNSVWQTHTILLGRPSGRYVDLFELILTFARKDSRDRSYCEGLRHPIHSKQSYYSEMASGADYELNENYVHASGAFSLPRQRFISYHSRYVSCPKRFG